MRIVNFIHTLGFGGAERQLSYIAPELVRLNHDVHIAYFQDGTYNHRLRDGGVILHKLTVKSNYDIDIIFQFDKLVRKLQPAIIQTWNTQADIIGGIIAMKDRKIFILREPNNAELYPLTIKNMVRKFIGRRASAIISNSKGGDSYWQNLGFSGPRYIIHNALPIGEIPDFNENTLLKLGIGDDQKYILYAGRIDTIQKNILTLFYAFLKVVKNYPVKALICGDGPDRRLLENFIMEHGVADKIIMPGFVSDIWSLIKRAEFLVSVSNFEGRPNVVIEAIACGCPLLLSDIPAHREFLSEETAFFVDKGNVEAIASEILKIIENPKLAKSKAVRANKIAEEWSLSTITKLYEEAYKSII